MGRPTSEWPIRGGGGAQAKTVKLDTFYMLAILYTGSENIVSRED